MLGSPSWALDGMNGDWGRIWFASWNRDPNLCLLHSTPDVSHTLLYHRQKNSINIMVSTYISYCFGLEIELLLLSRTKNHRSWKSLACELSTRLDRSGIPNHLNESSDSSPQNYIEWSITQEVIIPVQMGKRNQC
ncbi:hypothetical protein F5Y12DRAFT_777242 [Xylaria sp. FL1777]|nr:hypothetical protein F5Y12DRAFT_777242 [Xylaria sp. FL1777]